MTTLPDEYDESDKTTSEKILEFAARFAPGMKPGSRSEDHASELYDDDVSKPYRCASRQTVFLSVA